MPRLTVYATKEHKLKVYATISIRYGISLVRSGIEAVGYVVSYQLGFSQCLETVESR